MKDNFELIEKMLNEMGVVDIPVSFKKIEEPKSILDLNREAERFINDPVAYILNVHDIDINKHILEILLSIHLNVERIIVNTTLYDTDKSIVKLQNAIGSYNYMLSGDIDIPRYLLYYDFNNKDILHTMFYKTTAVGFTNKQIKMDTFDEVQDLPTLLPSNKFIYFVNNHVAQQFKNTVQPFNFDDIRNGAIGVEITPQYDIDALYLKWVNDDELSTIERYYKVFNTTIKDQSNIDFAEKYMEGYNKEGRSHNKGKSDNDTYIFMVNNGVNVIIMITDSTYKGDKIIQIPYNNNVSGSILSIVIKYILYITKGDDIHIVACEGILPHVVDHLIGWILCTTNRKVEKILYDLDMNLPVAEYLSRLVERDLDFIYEDTNVVNSIVNFLRDGDITPYTNLLLLISRYMKEFDEPECDTQGLDPFSNTLNQYQMEIIKYQCITSIKYFAENILMPISKELDFDLGFDSDEVKELLDKYNNTINRVIINQGPNSINIALITALWHKMRGMFLADKHCETLPGTRIVFNNRLSQLYCKIPQYLLCSQTFTTYGIVMDPSTTVYPNYNKYFIISDNIDEDVMNDERTLVLQSRLGKLESPNGAKFSVIDIDLNNIYISKEESEKHKIKLGEPKPPTLLLDTPIHDLKDILQTGVYVLGVDKSVHKDNLPLVKYIDSSISLYKNANSLSIYNGEELIYTV